VKRATITLLALVALGACAARTSELPLQRLVDTLLRDTSICLGPDGTYYMTGTVEPFFGYNNEIRLWKSSDLKRWEAMGKVWSYGESPWHKPYLEKKMSLWAPEIHYLKGTFWLTYSMPGWDGTPKTSGSGLLKSSTGKPEGPYVDMQPGERLGDEIDASLFEDDDGTVYFVWHSGKVARMKPDMSGFAEPYHWLKTETADPDPKHHSGLCAKIFGAGSFDHVGYEGMYLFKANGRYCWTGAENINGHYDCMVATSENIYGPYGARYVAVPDGGHVTFFKDAKGEWWSTFFGTDKSAPIVQRPAIVPMAIDKDGTLKVDGGRLSKAK
jgi:beta-xylosidase